LPGHGETTSAGNTITGASFYQAASPLKFDGVPTQGASIAVGLDGPPDPDTTYKWVQIEGPPAKIEDDTKPTIHLTVPPNAERLGFLVTLKNASGQRSARVIVPIRPGVGSALSETLRADAGDDQIGIVGRRITLNGSHSRTIDQVSYRWFQIGGPRVEQPLQDQGYYSFTPAKAGIYRFGLVVAANRRDAAPLISDPDEAVVTVGEQPMSETAVGGGNFPSAFRAPSLEQALRGARGLAPPPALEQIAEVWEAVSSKATLYFTFAELTSEMSRRLDTVAPGDAYTRQLWVQAIFVPLTQNIVDEMLTVGVDLRFPQNHYLELTAIQKEKLQRLFNSYAKEFRSRSQAH
jgi:hypothetical protein